MEEKGRTTFAFDSYREETYNESIDRGQIEITLRVNKSI